MIRTIPSLSKVSKAIPKAKATIPYHAMPTKINNLPRLPIPGLKDTIDRYLRSTKPLTTPSSYSHQVSLTSKFLSSVAPLLHSSIVSTDVRNSKDLLHSSSNSYIESHWNTMYLSGRWSLPCNSNPFYILENFKGLQDLADLTTKLVLWEKNMREEGLEDDGGCQQSYPLTVSTSRHPHPTFDYLQTHSSSYVILIKNNVYYKVPINTAENTRRSFEYIQGLEEEEEFNVGVGTCLDRNSWYDLKSDLGNVKSFETIDNAAFIICLDSPSPLTPNEESHNMLASYNNRWYDKHQLIMLGNGVIGFNWEHSFSDGMIWNRLIQDCENMIINDSEEEWIPPKPVTFNLTSSDNKMLEDATDKASNELSQCISNHLQGSYGKNVLKTWKVSPDATMQMAYQIAYHNMHERVAPTYESCATRNFWRGRTETIRSCTEESKRFVEVFKGDGSVDFKREAFREAAMRHVEIAGEAKMGMGVDRIFLALEKEAEKMGVEVELFNDEVYKESKNWRLSTSNVSHPSLRRFGFGPVVGDGYGLGYLVGEDTFSVNVTNFKGGGTDGERMKREIEEAVDGLRKLF
ncbi:hypothetical protein TrST_g5436 [Triparma strigata]|uniref:Choline/carnitine acyltransferase domain-containing protein n=1 Tax=Triparma strigata TaxID=1606541 RepID=A0A9W7ACR3_9STRA|nr:hypothetical protein TrST_g5436 [Triparma strigata]